MAFYEVFTQVQGDMELVAGRLRKTDTAIVTVTIENQIIETLAGDDRGAQEGAGGQ